MRISLALFASFLALTAVACGDSTSSPPDLCANSGAAATVRANDDYTFTPDTDTITVGQSVCWQNTGNLMHTVMGIDLPGGQTFVWTSSFASTVLYHCTRHSTMTGTVVVNP